MGTPPDLPDELLLAPFRGTAAIAARLTTLGRLRGRSWRRIAKDVYVHRDVPDGPELRRSALRLMLAPGNVACGRTAAWLHGLWEPLPGRPVPIETTRALHASGRAPEGHSRRRLTLTDIGLEGDVMDLDGLRCLTPRRVCFDLMRERNLVEAVVVADAFAVAGAILLPEFYAYVDAHHRWPGVEQARLALGFATTYALSPGETRLRMIVVLGGFPEPYVNVPFWAGEPAELIAHPDLLLLHVPRPAGLEYDGAVHGTPGNQRIDRMRANRVISRSSLPLLRYDNEAVTCRRDGIVAEIAELTEYPTRRLHTLEARDFWLPRPALRW